MIELIVICWLHLHNAEVGYEKFMCGGGAFIKGNYHTGILDRANKRYIRAIQSLAMVRRLRLPAVQVNIGEKQINMAQGSGGISLSAVEAPHHSDTNHDEE